MTARDTMPLLGALVLSGAGLATTSHAQAGWVLDEQKISDTVGGFGGGLDDEDYFGGAVAWLGDLDGDGIGDLAVGATGDDVDPVFDDEHGAVWILFLNADGTAKAEQKIDETHGGFGGDLLEYDYFGCSLACPGDLDGDGVVDLAVGAWHDGRHPGGSFTMEGAFWILFLNPDGTVKGEQKINDTNGGFGGALDYLDHFGWSVASLGDLDDDGTPDLAVGARNDDDAVFDAGAVWILFMNPDGTVGGEQKISGAAGGFGGTLDQCDWFGCGVAGIGDLDGDGIEDLAVGARGDDDGGGSSKGAIWILFLHPDGTVKAEQKISALSGGFGGVTNLLGSTLGALGDLDGDGNPEVASGTLGHESVWILFLAADGTVRSELMINACGEGGFGGDCDYAVHFGSAICSLGDHDGDGFPDMAVGSQYKDDGGTWRGAVWNLFLQGCPDASATFRNPDVGGSTNPAVYDVTAPPVLGATFSASIATAGMAGSWLVGYSTPLTFPTPWGNLLVNTNDPNGELLGMPFGVGDPAVIDLVVPDDPALCGFMCATQGLRFGSGLDLTNAQDLRLGR